MNFNSTLLTISDTELYHHKEANIISQKAKKISKELEIIDDELYAGHSTMTNYIYIDGPIHKMVNVLVTYDVFYFLDDFFGEDTHTGERPKMNEVLEIWKGEKMHHSKNEEINKLYLGIDYISKIIRKDSPETFFNKYTNSVIEHLSASLINKKYKTVDEYIAIRLISGGMYPVIDLIEYIHSIYLSEALINNDNIYIKELCKQCALIGALSNDIFSYAKEKHSDYNLINAYLISKEASNYNEAIIKAINKVNDIHSDYKLTLNKVNTETLTSDDKLIVDKFIKALDVIVSASYHWQKSTHRYYHSENVFDDMRVNA